MDNNIILLGAPGSGKGTVASRLSEEFGFYHINTGAIIRRNQKEKTKIGLIADKIVDSGGLLPDRIVNEMIKQEIIDNEGSGFIFDGFPRTLSQAKMLDTLFYNKKQKLDDIFLIDASKSVILERVLSRGESGDRVDDTKEVFEVRYKNYISETKLVSSYFEGRGKLCVVDGEEDKEDVYQSVRTRFL